MRFARALAVLAVAATLSAGAAVFSVPMKMSYQGYLTSGGVPVNATVSMDLKLYDAATGGSLIWTETQSVAVVNGVYNVVLGNTTPLDPNSFLGLPPLHLTVAVNGDPDMMPRTPLASAPYAITARSLEGTLTVNHGGTGSNNFTTNGLLYGNSSNTLGVTSAGGAGQFLTATAAGVPQWSNSSTPNLLISHTGAGSFTIQSAGTGVSVQNVAFTGGNIGLSASNALSVGGNQVVAAQQPAVANAQNGLGIDFGAPGNLRFVPSTNCDNVTVPPGGSCTITVTFSGLTAGADLATLTLPSNASNSPHRVTLAKYPLGSGSSPAQASADAIEVSKTALFDFTTTDTQTVTYTNHAGTPVQFGQATTGAPFVTLAEYQALVEQFNTLLARLRAHGLIAP